MLSATLAWDQSDIFFNKYKNALPGKVAGKALDISIGKKKQ
jgi:hypothetical protein